MSNILGYEPLVNETINILTHQLDRKYADTGDVCDLDKWLLYCQTSMNGIISVLPS